MPNREDGLFPHIKDRQDEDHRVAQANRAVRGDGLIVGYRVCCRRLWGVEPRSVTFKTEQEARDYLAQFGPKDGFVREVRA